MKMKYRGYILQPNSYLGYTYVSESYDGPEDGRCGHGTLKDCMHAIDDIIADALFCKKCDSTGKYVDCDQYMHDCEDCADVRAKLDGIEYPKVCLNCGADFIELWQGSGKENMICRC